MSRWYFIFAANLSNPFKLAPSDLDSDLNFFVYEFRQGVSKLSHFDNNDPLILPAMVIPPWTNETNGNCTYPPCGQLIDYRYYIAGSPRCRVFEL